MRQLCIGSRASSESAVGKSLPSNGLRSQILSVPSVQGRFNSVMSESRYAYMHLICIRECRGFCSRTEDPHEHIFVGATSPFSDRPIFWAKTSQIRKASAPQAGALPDDGLFGFFLYSGVAFCESPGVMFFFCGSSVGLVISMNK